MSSIAPAIVPHRWFDEEAVEAAGFYVSVFPDSRITNVVRLEHTPSGSIDIAARERATGSASGEGTGASR